MLASKMPGGVQRAARLAAVCGVPTAAGGAAIHAAGSKHHCFAQAAAAAGREHAAARRHQKQGDFSSNRTTATPATSRHLASTCRRPAVAKQRQQPAMSLRQHAGHVASKCLRLVGVSKQIADAEQLLARSRQHKQPAERRCPSIGNSSGQSAARQRAPAAAAPSSGNTTADDNS